MSSTVIAGFTWIEAVTSTGLVAIASFLMRLTQTNPAPLIVSILIFFFADAHVAITVANACTCILTFPTFILDIFRHKKYDALSPLLQWDLLILFQPFTLLGALIGSICNTLFPSWVLNIFACLLLILVVGKRISYLFLIRSDIEEEKALLRQDQIVTASQQHPHDNTIKHFRQISYLQRLGSNTKAQHNTVASTRKSLNSSLVRNEQMHLYTLGTTDAQIPETFGEPTTGTQTCTNQSSHTANESLEHSKLVEQLLEGHSVSAYESMNFGLTSSSSSSSSDSVVAQTSGRQKKVIHGVSFKDHRRNLSLTTPGKQKNVLKSVQIPTSSSKNKVPSTATPVSTSSQGKIFQGHTPVSRRADPPHQSELHSESEIKEITVQLHDQGSVQDCRIHSHSALELIYENRDTAPSKSSVLESEDVASKSVNCPVTKADKPLINGSDPCFQIKDDAENSFLHNNPLNDIPKAIHLTDKGTIRGFGISHFGAIDPLRTFMFWLLEFLVLATIGLAIHFGAKEGSKCNELLAIFLGAACMLSLVQAVFQMTVIRIRIKAFYTLVNESLLTTSTDEHIRKYKLTCGTLRPEPLICIRSHVKIALYSFMSGLTVSLVGYGSDLVVLGLFDKLQMHRRTFVALQFAYIFFSSLYAFLMELTFNTVCIIPTTIYAVIALVAGLLAYALCDRLMERLSTRGICILHITHSVFYIITFLISISYLIMFFISAASTGHVDGIEVLCLSKRHYCTGSKH
ncbi:Hypothetical protein GSB_150822 [Giardia duodenalis]|uniref:Uncharacterized protein n=2 Tax=Giardia intestinalis TaxID=5741 RepID=C6LX35_GIAIB|nr:Hypothetical protein GL50581_3349 [Giardia intestinalis ATCC 50581]ESU45680.1 Hypothetical protein GSB_150822 [Giardia intestinalis]